MKATGTMTAALLGLAFLSNMAFAVDESEDQTEVINFDVIDGSTEALRASVSCSKNVQNTWGSVTCTTSGGAYTLKQVRFDCSAQGDKVVNNITINGSWSMSHECRFKLTRIQITI